MVRRGSSLVPLSEADQESLIAFPHGRILQVEIQPAPAKKIQRWYWAMLTKLVTATGQWPDKETAHAALLVSLGYVDHGVMAREGDVRIVPQSTADWHPHRWREYAQRVVEHVAAHILPGVSLPQWRREIERFVGIRLKEVMEDGDE